MCYTSREISVWKLWREVRSKGVVLTSLFICFHWSPVTRDIESRIICSPDYNEGTNWINNVAEFYAKYKLPYATYINGEMDESEGNLETGEWR